MPVTPTSQSLVKQVAVYNENGNWDINNIGVDANNVILNSQKVGGANLQAALDNLLGSSTLNANQIVVTDQNKRLTTTANSSQFLNLNLVNGSTQGSLRGISTVKELPGVNDYIMGQYAFSEGFSTRASGLASHVEGYLTTASGSASHAEGNNTIANGTYSHAEGSSTTASGSISHAEGNNTIANGDYSHAEGKGDNDNTRIFPNDNIFIQSPYNTAGSYTLTSDNASIDWSILQVGDKIQLIENSEFVGYISNIVINSISNSVDFSIPEYDPNEDPVFSDPVACKIIKQTNTIAHGKYSHAEGNSTKAIGEASHTEGKNTIATGKCSHAEGKSTIANKHYSHAEGSNTTASGYYSHTEGSRTKASGEASHAEGKNTTAEGDYSYAGGYNTTAAGNGSHAQNLGTIAVYAGQTAIGTYNKNEQDNIFIIGNGNSNNDRSNALVVKRNGNTTIAGSLTQSSDKNLKQHISYLNNDAVDFIKQLKPAYYTKDEQKHVGFYAQDIEEIDKWNCMVGEMNGYKTLSYTELIAPLVKYCQSLEKRIEELENKK